MASSLAFLKIPFRRLEKVTCRLVELSILRITIFPLPISLSLLTFSRPSRSARWLEIYGDMIVALQEQGRRQDQRQAKKGNKGEEEIWWELSKKKAQKQQVSQREEERGNE